MRAITFALQKEGSKIKDFKDWYKLKQKEMKNDELLQFINQARTEDFHEGKHNLTFSSNINHFSTNNAGPKPTENARIGINNDGVYWIVNDGYSFNRRIPIIKGGRFFTEIAIKNPPKMHLGIKLKQNDPINYNSEIEGINLKNNLVSGLIEKVKNEAFSERHDFYGRTAAFSSSEITDVSVILNVKIRYVVNTEPKSLMEEIAQIGFELFNPEIKLTEERVKKIWDSQWDNHDKNEKYIQKHLKKALELQMLNDLLKKLGQERLQVIIKERRDMINNLKEQGVATDLEGIDNIEVVGIDLLTITLIYPKLGE